MTYTPRTKLERFNTAVNALEAFLDAYKPSYEYKLEESTTNSFKAFKREVEELGYMKVSTEGCLHTIYSEANYNILARVWHDEVHLKYNLGFNPSDEYNVCYIQIEEVSSYLLSNGYHPCTVEDVKEVLYHDIIGQVDYYRDNKSFVEFQRRFVYDRFISEVA